MARTILGISLDESLKKSRKFEMVLKVLTALYTPCVELIENLELKNKQLRASLKELSQKKSILNAIPLNAMLEGLKNEEFVKEKYAWLEERRDYE
jgi:hypothetical protein